MKRILITEMTLELSPTQIPGGNEWWVEDGWTVDMLIADVVGIVTSKQGDPANFDLYCGGKKMKRGELLNVQEDGTQYNIRWRERNK